MRFTVTPAPTGTSSPPKQLPVPCRQPPRPSSYGQTAALRASEAAPLAAPQPTGQSRVPAGPGLPGCRGSPDAIRGCPTGSAALPPGQPRPKSGQPRGQPRSRTTLKETWAVQN